MQMRCDHKSIASAYHLQYPKTISIVARNDLQAMLHRARHIHIVLGGYLMLYNTKCVLVSSAILGLL